MALNLSDPGAIVGAYESIIDVHSSHNWLLLRYSNFDELFLSDHGTGGLEELKSKVQDLEHVFIAFYREEVDVEPGFILINYIPPSVSGVKRARALVHSRRIGTIFQKHQTTLTVDELTKLTHDAIHYALDPEPQPEPDTPTTPSSLTSTSSMGRVIPQSTDSNKLSQFHPVCRTESPPSSGVVAPNKALPFEPARRVFTESEDLYPLATPPARKASPPLEPVRRAFTESETPFSPSGIPSPANKSSAPFEPVRRAFSESDNPSFPDTSPPIAKSTSMFTNLIRRRKKSSADGSPPPTPPKDKGKFGVQQPQYQHISSHTLTMYPRVGGHIENLSEFAVISHENDYDNRLQDPYPQSLPLRGKWAPDGLDPTERVRRRQEAKEQRAREHEEALRAEKQRREDMKRRKELLLKEEAEEHERRQALLREELRQIAVERKRKERLEKEEEERKREELEERKRVDRERRMEEHKKLEAWRKEQARMADEAVRRAEEARKREEVERNKKIMVAEAKVKRNQTIDALVTGWVTMQTNDTLLWKRRFFRFMGTAAYFYRSPNDTQQFLDKIELRNQIQGLREWNEGYEDLEAIPHSFAVEFKDGREPWSMYTDSEEEKYKLLGLLHHAAGL